MRCRLTAAVWPFILLFQVDSTWDASTCEAYATPSPRHSNPLRPVPIPAPPPPPPPASGGYARAQLQQMPVRDMKAALAPYGIDCDAVLEKSERVELVWAVQESSQVEAGKGSSGSGSGSGAPAQPSRGPHPLCRSPSGSRRNPTTGLMECGICSEAMGAGTALPMATAPCGHMYCQECWLRTAAVQHKCPSCRRPVAPSHVIKLYVD